MAEVISKLVNETRYDRILTAVGNQTPGPLDQSLVSYQLSYQNVEMFPLDMIMQEGATFEFLQICIHNINTTSEPLFLSSQCNRH